MSTSEAHKQALRRLWTVANGHSGQCKTVAKFLLGLYDGDRFPFDLTDFRTLDQSLFRDCLAVLEMDYQPEVEVHVRLGLIHGEFERLAEDWGIRDCSRDPNSNSDS